MTSINATETNTTETELPSTDDIFVNAKRASRFLKALANDNRLVILCTLADGERNVGELEQILGIRQPTLSQQLARLRLDELVETRRASRQIYYGLASNEAKQMIELLNDLFCSKTEEPAATGEDKTAFA